MEMKRREFLSSFCNLFRVFVITLGLMAIVVSCGGKMVPRPGIWSGDDISSVAVEAPEINFLTREVSICRRPKNAILEGSLTVSSDIKHVAYVEVLGVYWDGTIIGQVVVDGVVQGLYNDVDFLSFSPDNQRVAYAAKSGEKWVVVVDGVVGTEYSEIHSLCFSPDSQRVAYAAKSGEKWVVVVDGVVGWKYSKIHSLCFSPDSQRVAYIACHSIFSKDFVVVDGVEGKEYKWINPGTLTFSPDSKHIAYGTKSKDTWFVVFDGVEERVEWNMASEGRLLFYSPSRFHIFASRGDEYLRLEIEIVTLAAPAE